MKRGYDPHYGSREQLRAQSEHGMKVARERDALKAENEKLKALIARALTELSSCEDDHCFLHWERINHETSETS